MIQSLTADFGKHYLNKSGVLLILSMITLFLFGQLVSGQQVSLNKDKEAKQAKETYSIKSFNIVFENDIFDPNRDVAAVTKPVAEIASPPPAKQEYIELTGVMIYEEGAVAFFVASDPLLTGACEEGMAIAGYFLMDVDNNSVTLVNAESLIVLPVGMRLGKKGDVAWQVEDAPYRSAYRRPMTSLAARSTKTRNSARVNQNQFEQARTEAVNTAMQRVAERGGRTGGMMRNLLEYGRAAAAFEEERANLSMQSFELRSNNNVSYDLFYQEPDR